jgi:hypothetical protein
VSIGYGGEGGGLPIASVALYINSSKFLDTWMRRFTEARLHSRLSCVKAKGTGIIVLI